MQLDRRKQFCFQMSFFRWPRLALDSDGQTLQALREHSFFRGPPDALGEENFCTRGMSSANCWLNLEIFGMASEKTTCCTKLIPGWIGSLNETLIYQIYGSQLPDLPATSSKRSSLRSGEGLDPRWLLKFASWVVNFHFLWEKFLCTWSATLDPHFLSHIPFLGAQLTPFGHFTWFHMAMEHHHHHVS